MKAEYDAAVERAGKVFNILKVQSLNPATPRASMDLYKATMHAVSGLSRAEQKLFATVFFHTYNYIKYVAYAQGTNSEPEMLQL